MTKRFKKGARVELTFGEWLETPADDGGRPALLRCGSSLWWLSAEDIRRIQAADLLEDVPEPKAPWERVRDEVCGAYGALVEMDDDLWEQVAARLGIKPEGE